MDPILQDLFSLNTTEPAVVFAISDRLEELGRMRELGILRSGKPWWWQNGKVRYDRRRFFLMSRRPLFDSLPGYMVYVVRQSWASRFQVSIEANKRSLDPWYHTIRPCSQKRAIQVGWHYYWQDIESPLPAHRNYFFLGVPFADYNSVYTTINKVLARCEQACKILASQVPIS